MRKNVVTFENIIDCVRRQVSDEGARVAEIPIPFSLTWWPNSPDVSQQLMSDYGISSGPEQLDKEFDAEVSANHECLDKLEHVPSLGGPGQTRYLRTSPAILARA